MIDYRIILHPANQHGWGVSLMKLVDGEIETGFTLISLDSREKQLRYAEELHQMTNWAWEDWFV